MRDCFHLIDELKKKNICLAPMAEVNDLAFRMLCRNHGVKICWTGMINSFQWSQGDGYRKKAFMHVDEDHPLIGQLAGADHEQIIQAAIDLSQFCDAIDINLGCTMRIAGRSQYGYYMCDTVAKRERVCELFKALSSRVSVPIFAKIRIIMNDDGLPDTDITVAFAKALEKSGASAIQVHARFEHRNKNSEVMYDVIKRVVEAVRIPVIANGGIYSKEEAERVMDITGAVSVSVGQALLENPTKFDPDGELNREMFMLEYLELSKRYFNGIFAPSKMTFKYYDQQIRANPELATIIKNAKTIDELITFVKEQH